jgi:hypothetical protein
LRRKRRHSTQVFKKKNTTSQKSPYQRSFNQSDSKWKRWLALLLFVIIFSAAAYYLYTFEYDTDSLEKIESQADTAVTTSPTQEKQVEIESIPPIEQNIQIEILNGCGVNGIAKLFQSHLRQQGFDVVNTDNYIEDGKRRWDVKDSKIIDHIGNGEQAEALARSMGIPADKITVKESATAIYDMSVIIGKDYKKLKGFK